MNENNITQIVLTDFIHIEQYIQDNFHINLDVKDKPEKYLLDLWDKLYEYYILQVSRADNVGFMEAVNIRSRNDNIDTLKTTIMMTPYYRIEPGVYETYEETKENKSWENFKNDILERGSFFVFMIEFHDHFVTIVEGNHRFVATKELIKEGRLSKDHKILCMETKGTWRKVNMIAVELGKIEKELRTRFNIIKQPRPEIKDETYFGYLRNIPEYINVPEMEKRFKNVCYMDWRLKHQKP